MYAKLAVKKIVATEYKEAWHLVLTPCSQTWYHLMTTNKFPMFAKVRQTNLIIEFNVRGRWTDIIGIAELPWCWHA